LNVDPLLLHVLTALHVAVAGAFVADLLHQHRSQGATIAWILVLLLFPYLGLALYFFAGAPRKRGTRLEPLLRESMRDVAAQSRTTDHPVENLLRALGMPGASYGNRVSFAHDNVQAADDLAGVIASARRSLFLSVFSFEDDTSGRLIANQLVQCAAAGIDVRMLVDGYGSKELPWQLLRRLRSARVQIRHFRPLLWSAARRGGMNYRNHRKMLLADRHTVWLGGRNLADKYLTNPADGSHWTDLSLTISGPAVREFACVAASDWREASGETHSVPSGDGLVTENAGSSCVQVLPSGPDLEDDTIHAALLASIMQASKRIWIASPFFVPDDALLVALRIACRRQVDVRIVVPRRSNQIMADWVRSSYLQELQQAGARVFFFETGMLHAKAVVTDDTLALVGSANFDMRSHFTNHEICAALFTTGDIQAVAACINNYFENATEGLRHSSFGARVLGGALRIVAPLF
jgi:cardiolipin synthase